MKSVKKTAIINKYYLLTCFCFLIGCISTQQVVAQELEGPQLPSEEELIESEKRPSLSPLPNDSIPAGDEKIIEILSTDELEVTNTDDKEVRQLKGNVKLKQDDAIMECDRAFYYKNDNNIEAFGNIHIQQGDSVDIYADYLFYNGDTKLAKLYKNVHLTDQKSDIKADTLIYDLNTRKAVLQSNVYLTDKKHDVYADSVEYYVNTKQSELYDNVRLTDGEMEITSDRMDYNVNEQIGNYSGGGKLVNKETTLTSDKGNYDGNSRKVKFEKDVHLESPEYDLQTEQLDYDIATEEAEFNGPTTIVSDKQEIQANAGVYKPKSDELILQDRISMASAGQSLTADNFEYNKKDGYGKAQGDVVIVDTTQNLTIKSQYANFYEEEDKVIAYDDALLINVVEEDSLFLTADTLVTYAEPDPESPGDTVKTFYAYENVKILKQDMQGVCDSLMYSFKDSTFKMFYDPIIWSDDFQLYADTIFVFTKNNRVQKFEMLRSAYMANKLQDGVYNQVNGKNILGYFGGGNIREVEVEGNAESIYFIQNEQEAYEGVNRATSSEMLISFKQQKVQQIKFIENAKAAFHPMKKVRIADFIIKGFKWREERRPKTLKDLVM